MATIRYSMRQKKWIVTWKVRGATFHHECSFVLRNPEDHIPKREGTVHANQAHPQKHHHPGTVRSPLQPVLKTSDNNQAGSLSRQTSAPIPRNQASSVHNSKRNSGFLQIPESIWSGPIHDPQADFSAAFNRKLGKKRRVSIFSH